LNLKIERVDIKSLLKDPTNARKHPDKNLDSIKASLNKFGQVEPLIVNEKTNIVISGNGRLEVMQSLGWETVDVIKVDLNSVDAAQLGLVLNKTAELAEWDDDVLKKTLSALMDEGIEIEDFGFDIDDLGLGGEGGAGLTDEDAVPEVAQNIHNVKLGDVWQLGNHRLMCGDSTVKENVERLMDGKKADMVFTDPPYGISYDDTKHKDHGKYKSSNFGMIIGDDKQFVFKVFEWLPQDEQIWWGANYYCQQIPQTGSWYVWDKKTEAMQENGMLFTNDFEIAWSKKKHKQEICRKIWAGAINKEKGETRLHPTQKPISIAEWFFERIKADSVLDLFLGSGSTLIACEKTNRTCYGLELDPHYCSVIIERWQQFTGKTAILEAGNNPAGQNND
jgi:DNA modification methylase